MKKYVACVQNVLWHFVLLYCNNTRFLWTFWRLQIQPESRNGGFLRVTNYDGGLPGVVQTQYYTGTTLLHRSSITFDFVPPEHCSIVSQCNQNMLEVGPPYTVEVKLSYSPWQYCINVGGLYENKAQWRWWYSINQPAFGQNRKLSTSRWDRRDFFL